MNLSRLWKGREPGSDPGSSGTTIKTTATERSDARDAIAVGQMTNSKIIVQNSEDTNDAVRGVSVTVKGDQSDNKQPLNHQVTLVSGTVTIEGMLGDQPMITKVSCENGIVSNLNMILDEELRKKYRYRTQCKVRGGPSCAEVIPKLQNEHDQPMREFRKEMKQKFGANLSRFGKGCLEIEFHHSDKTEAEGMKNNEHVVKDSVVNFLKNIDAKPTDEINLNINVSENPLWNESSDSGPDQQSSVMPNRQSESASESQASDREILEHVPQKKARLTTKQQTDSESDSDSPTSDIGFWKEAPKKNPGPGPTCISLGTEPSTKTLIPKETSLKRKSTTKSESDSENVSFINPLTKVISYWSEPESDFLPMRLATKQQTDSESHSDSPTSCIGFWKEAPKKNPGPDPTNISLVTESSTKTLIPKETSLKRKSTKKSESDSENVPFIKVISYGSEPEFEVLPCLTCRSVMVETVDRPSFCIHVDTLIFETTLEVRLKNKTLDRLVRRITALRNSGGGSIYIHLVGPESARFDMTLFDEFISERRRVFVKAEDGECDEHIYSFDFHRTRDDVIVLAIQASQSIITFDNKTTINRLNVCTDKQIKCFLFGEETALADGSPTVRGIYDIKNTRNTRVVTLSPGEKMDSEETITNIWYRENLHKHLTSLSKLTSGGSIYIGRTDSRPFLTSYNSPTGQIMHGRQRLVKFGFPFTSNEKTYVQDILSRKIKDEHLWGNGKGPVQDVTGYFRICFHRVDADEEVIEIAIGRFPGCVFFDKRGPEAYEVELEVTDMTLYMKRLSFTAWLERQRSGNAQGSVL